MTTGRLATSIETWGCPRRSSCALTGALKAATWGRPMSRSSAATSRLSVRSLSRPSVAAADRQERLTVAGLLALALAWLTYTRLYFWLHPRRLTFDPSAFMYLTGKPDPSCGLTRTFAWMWRGDLAHA